MTNNNIFPQNNFINSTTENVNLIKLSINKGIIRGNIIDGSIDTTVGVVPCGESLIFVCIDNSQYIPLL